MSAVTLVRGLALAVTALTFTAGCASSDTIHSRQYGQLLVCHEGETIAVSNASFLDHQQHGDAPGPCASGN